MEAVNGKRLEVTQKAIEKGAQKFFGEDSHAPSLLCLLFGGSGDDWKSIQWSRDDMAIACRKLSLFSPLENGENKEALVTVAKVYAFCCYVLSMDELARTTTTLAKLVKSIDSRHKAMSLRTKVQLPGYTSSRFVEYPRDTIRHTDPQLPSYFTSDRNSNVGEIQSLRNFLDVISYPVPRQLLCLQTGIFRVPSDDPFPSLTKSGSGFLIPGAWVNACVSRNSQARFSGQYAVRQDSQLGLVDGVNAIIRGRPVLPPDMSPPPLEEKYLDILASPNLDQRWSIVADYQPDISKRELLESRTVVWDAHVYREDGGPLVDRYLRISTETPHRVSLETRTDFSDQIESLSFTTSRDGINAGLARSCEFFVQVVRCVPGLRDAFSDSEFFDVIKSIYEQTQMTYSYSWLEYPGNSGSASGIALRRFTPTRIAETLSKIRQPVSIIGDDGKVVDPSTYFLRNAVDKNKIIWNTPVIERDASRIQEEQEIPVLFESRTRPISGKKSTHEYIL